MKVTFDHKHEETPNITTFYFRSDSPLEYQPGQYVELTLLHSNPDNRGTKRWFSLSSAPTEKLLSITTRIVVKDSSTFTKALRALQPGTQLDIGKPRGTFLLHKDAEKPLVFVAGGIGITSFRSMLKWLQDTEQQRRITLLYGVSHAEDVIFREVFDKPDYNVTLAVGTPAPEWKGQSGRLSAPLILETAKPTADTLIYLSGPEAMVKSLGDELRTQGIKKQQLVLDAFLGYQNI